MFTIYGSRQTWYTSLCWENGAFFVPIPRRYDYLPAPATTGTVPLNATAPRQHPTAYSPILERVEFLSATWATVPPSTAYLSYHWSYPLFCCCAPNVRCDISTVNFYR